MGSIINWIGLKAMAIIVAVLLVTILGMSVVLWWIKGEWEDAQKDLGLCTAQVSLLSTAIEKQNKSIEELGTKKKEADQKRREAEVKAGKLKKQLDARIKEVQDYIPDPKKNECDNAMDLIRKAKQK